MTSSFILANVLGAAGFTALFISTRQASVVRLLAWGGVGAMLLAPHWLLLDRPVAAGMNVVYALASVLGTLAAEGKVSRRWYKTVYPAAIILAAIGYHSAIDIAALTATLIGLWATGQPNITRLRHGLLASHIVWAAFGMITGSVFRVVFSAVMSSSLIERLITDLRSRRAATNLTREGVDV